jgi:putative Mg2+ transporter-C (MgtC) family protein
VGLGFQVAAAGLTLVILVILRSTQVIEATTNRHD